ncbi:MBL fold metallo-hydrolase [Halorubrum laminariae]|uniref:MBL fold metallo-hydrolase n=1 Tax=Halorubrum laminariae TaxID=1433523 RepID=A0ABD6C140_9EURY|nr:MBL fold metallo-hydrolase [Halorubrum laminariae]
MNIKCQYANRSKTSVLLTVEGVLQGQSVNLLVDPGPGVDVDGLLGQDEYLTGILLTHLHMDHYATLGENMRDGAPVYTSQTNIDLLDVAVDDANNFVDTAIDKSEIKRSATPVDDGVTIGGKIDITAVPAGHTPGAIGFYLELSSGGETESILITGDFTRRPVAGYPGLPPVDADLVVLTGATEADFEDNLTEAVATTIRQGLSGSPALVTATALNAVHFATVLGTAIEEGDFEMGVSVVGKAAKMLDKLDLTPPHVTAIPKYAPEAVLSENPITITGPDLPTEGGARKLFRQIKDDPNAGAILLSGDEEADIGSYNCTLNQFRFSNHPTETTVDEYIELVNPREIYLTHQKGSELRRYRDKYSAIVWAPRERKCYTLYRNGEWVAPFWVKDKAAKHLLKTTQERSNIEFRPAEGHTLDALDDVSLAAEGLDMSSITFSKPSHPVDAKYNTTSGAEPKPIRTDGAVAETPTAENTPPAPKSERVLEIESAIAHLEELKEEITDDTTVATVEKVTSKHVLLRPINGGTEGIAAGDTIEIGRSRS